MVDLSETPPSRDELSPLEMRIVDALRQAAAGVLSKDELLDVLREHPFSDVERALRDLTLRGLVRVLWKTPFRFMAFLGGDRKDERGGRKPFQKATLA